MNVASSILLLAGSVLTVLAGIGILRFRTPYARFHAAGKATPVGFILIAAGASLELGWSAAALLAVSAVALSITLPIGVHLLFRAVHATSSNDHLVLDELTADRADSEAPR